MIGEPQVRRQWPGFISGTWRATIMQLDSFLRRTWGHANLFNRPRSKSSASFAPLPAHRMRGSAQVSTRDGGDASTEADTLTAPLDANAAEVGSDT